MYPRTKKGFVLFIVLSLIGIPLFLLTIGYYGREINHFFASLFYPEPTQPPDISATVRSQNMTNYNCTKIKVMIKN